MDEELMRWHAFASILGESIKVPAYATVGRISKDQSVTSFGSWVGGTITDVERATSRVPRTAYAKLGELAAQPGGAGCDGKLVMTTTKNLGYEYRELGYAAQNGVAVTVGGFDAQEHDQLLALLTLYNAIRSPLRLHHAGFRFP